MKQMLVPASTVVRSCGWALLILTFLTGPVFGAGVQSRYYGHAAVQDQYGELRRGITG